MSEATVYEPLRAPRVSHPVVRGLRHRLLEWGDPDSEPVLYLHGWGDTAATFQFVVDAFENDVHVLAYDWRGFGESEWGGPLYWFPEYLADLDAMLELQFPGRPATLIGHSMGANVAALYAGARSDRVRAFINIEGFGLSDSDPSDTPAHYERWLKRVSGPSKFATYSVFDELAQRVMQRSPRMGNAEAQFVAREWARESAPGNIQLKADPSHRLPNAVQYRRAEAEACWRAITAKTRLVAGAESRFLEAFKDWFLPTPDQRPFPAAELTVIEKAGHMLHFEAPAELARTIEEYLGDL